MTGLEDDGDPADAVRVRVERTFREESGRALATLIRLLGGDFDAAEEAVADAFVAALETWPRDGIPANPGAWITTAARNRALDRLRRARRHAEKLIEIERGLEAAGTESIVRLGTESRLADDRLRLIFTCCHPALALDARVALTLRTLGGLTTPEIARAFLVPEATLAQRIVRAKKKIRDAGIPYRVPPDHLLAERLDGVLAVLYLVFNEGYSATSGDTLVRRDLCAEAVRLTRLLAALMPDALEARALLALLLLQDSRRDARTGPDGGLILLEDQDRSRWDAAEIAEGLALVEACFRELPGGAMPGPYLVQAAIAACHGRSTTAGETPWAEIAALYGVLVVVAPGPVVELNRAVAVAMADGPADGLVLVEALGADGALAEYHLFHATRADLLRRMGRRADAAAAYERALGLATNDAERAFLARRLGEVRAAG
jgi:RNA polymerase sigma-70 factor, ECF subfamily